MSIIAQSRLFVGFGLLFHFFFCLCFLDRVSCIYPKMASNSLCSYVWTWLSSSCPHLQLAVELVTGTFKACPLSFHAEDWSQHLCMLASPQAMESQPQFSPICWQSSYDINSNTVYSLVQALECQGKESMLEPPSFYHIEYPQSELSM